jgi:hypothetical protein
MPLHLFAFPPTPANLKGVLFYIIGYSNPKAIVYPTVFRFSN